MPQVLFNRPFSFKALHVDSVSIMSLHIPFDFVVLRLNANIAEDFRIFPLLSVTFNSMFGSMCFHSEANRFSLWAKDSLILKKKYARTNVLKYSFFHRITDQWNQLLLDVGMSDNVNIFKSRVIFK